MSTKAVDSRQRYYKNKDKDLSVSYIFMLQCGWRGNLNVSCRHAYVVRHVISRFSITGTATWRVKLLICETAGRGVVSLKLEKVNKSPDFSLLKCRTSFSRIVHKTSKPEKPNCSVYFAGNILWIVELYQKLERNINWQIFISRTALIYKQSLAKRTLVVLSSRIHQNGWCREKE